MGILDEIKAEIPSTSTVIAIVLLIINIFLPGVGTIVMAFLDGFKLRTLIVGILQFVLTFVIIGWIWSIWWGILCLQKAK